MIGYKLYAYLYESDIMCLLLDTVEGINIGVTACTFEARINDAGNLQFQVARANQSYDDGEGHIISNVIDEIRIKDSTIGLQMLYIDDNGITQDSWWPFVGRPISISRDLYGNKSISCEGLMNCLNDTYMAYWDHKYNTIRQFIESGMQSYHSIKESIIPNLESRNIQFDTSSGSGLNNHFSFSKEYDKENRNTTYFKLLDGINDKILGPYGGVIHFVYTRYGSNKYFTIRFTYYDKITIGFDYNTPSGTLPEEYTYMSGDYGGPIPCFGIVDNIINITEQPVKDDLWTGIMPVGQNGITKMGDPHDVRDNDIMWIDQTSGMAFVGYVERIVKAVEFSEVEPGSSSGTELLSKGREYINKFANLNYFTNLNYTISGIEPCEVFGNVNKIVKPGYPVIINKEYEGGLTSAPCISIRHDVFDLQKSEYEAGPIIPQNIINEDISTWK